MLDGEGGYTVYAKLIPARAQPETRRLADRACPSRQAFAQRRRRRDFIRGTTFALDDNAQAVRIRRDMERQAQPAGKVMAAE